MCKQDYMKTTEVWEGIVAGISETAELFLGKGKSSTKTVFKIDHQLSEGMLFVETTYTFHCIRKESFEFSFAYSESEVGRNNKGCKSNLESPCSRKCMHCGCDGGPLGFRNEMLLI